MGDPHRLTSDATRRTGRRQAARSGVHRQRQQRLDRITRLSRTLFGVERTSITVLENDRAWFPSAQGFTVLEAPRVETFCDQTAARGATMVVEDARADARFRDLAVVADEGLRFYAGAPLRDAGGDVVGTLCLFDREPRDLDDEERETLEDLAAWAEQELAASAEMVRAGEVQSSMLPSRPVDTGAWAIDGLCVPSLAVGGDLFDYGVAGDTAHFGLGDVMGKGTGAALLGAGVRAAVRNTHEAVLAGVDLGVTTTQLARGLAADLARAESFVALFEAALELDDGYLRYVDAGMGLCLVVRADGRRERLSSDNLPIGILPDDHWVEQQTVLEPGDRLLLFSDGLLDLVEEQVAWESPVGDLVAAHDDPHDLLDAVARLTTTGLPTDDVTAVAVYRRDRSGAAS